MPKDLTFGEQTPETTDLADLTPEAAMAQTMRYSPMPIREWMRHRTIIKTTPEDLEIRFGEMSGTPQAALMRGDLTILMGRRTTPPLYMTHYMARSQPMRCPTMPKTPCPLCPTQEPGEMGAGAKTLARMAAKTAT